LCVESGVITMPATILQFRRKIDLVIKSPCCKRAQGMSYDQDTKIYFPVRPFCCEVMEIADSKEWNARLDLAIQNAKGKIRAH
jgi:hypothetical protein